MVVPVLLLSALALHTDMVRDTDMTRGAALLRDCQAEVRLMELGSLADASEADLINGAYCIGYLNGFAANLTSGRTTNCAPEGSMGQMVRFYVRYMEKNPSLLDMDKRVGLRKALEESFACEAAR